jgi:hypothetical protein
LREFSLPAYESGPETVKSLGSIPVRLAAECGLKLHPWQTHVLHRALGLHPLATNLAPKWSAMEVGILVPRQNGKGSILEALELAHIFVFKTKYITHSAHLAETAKSAMYRLDYLIDQSPKLKRMMPAKSMNKNDMTLATPYGIIKFSTRTDDKARGLQGDLVILDEAYDLDISQLAALIPTMATRPNPQIWYTSSTGMTNSYALKDLKERGRDLTQKDMVYLEWCALPPMDKHGNRIKDASGNFIPIPLDDIVEHDRANPSPLIRFEFSKVEQRTMKGGIEQYYRERLGIWEEVDDKYRLTLPSWDAVQVTDGSVQRDGKLVLGVDVSPGSRCASIVAAGQSGDLHLIEIAAHEQGIDWVIDKLKAIRSAKNVKAIVLDPNGPAGVLVPLLNTARIKYSALSRNESSQGCTSFISAVNDRKIVGLGDDLLRRAIDGAVQVVSGDGTIKWVRSKSVSDICSLVGATLANWELCKHGKSNIDINNTML